MLYISRNSILLVNAGEGSAETALYISRNSIFFVNKNVRKSWSKQSKKNLKKLLLV